MMNDLAFFGHDGEISNTTFIFALSKFENVQHFLNTSGRGN